VWTGWGGEAGLGLQFVEQWIVRGVLVLGRAFHLSLIETARRAVLPLRREWSTQTETIGLSGKEKARIRTGYRANLGLLPGAH
jgi:hypothetical protein